MSNDLPERPNLDQLRRQAKELLAAWRAHDEAALAELEQHHPQHRRRPGDPATLRLADAQLVIARRHGLASWAKLRAEIELRLLTFVERAAKLVAMAADASPGSGGEPLRIATGLLDREPGLAKVDIYTALVIGDVERVRKRLAADPGWVHATGGPLPARQPLHYVAFSRLHRRDPTIAAGLLACARLLLDAGADVNAAFSGDDTWGSQLPPLYGACGAANFPELAELLIDRGARLDDGESLYHANEHADTRCLELLLARGADPNSVNVIAHALDTAGTHRLELLLAHGGRGDGAMHDGTPLLVRAIAIGRGLDVVELLLAHGADARVAVRDGRSAVDLARAHGHPEVAARLVRAGADDRHTPLSRFVEACSDGDVAGARALAATSGLFAALTPLEVHAFLEIVERTDSRLALAMIDAGFPISVTNARGQTALHWAAWRGRDAVVERLLRCDAVELERREQQFGGTPLGWASHGNHAAPHDGGDHPAVVRRLLAAGADPGARNAWGEAMVGETDDSEVAALLRAAGAPEDP